MDTLNLKNILKNRVCEIKIYCTIALGIAVKNPQLPKVGRIWNEQPDPPQVGTPKWFISNYIFVAFCIAVIFWC